MRTQMKCFFVLLIIGLLSQSVFAQLTITSATAPTIQTSGTPGFTVKYFPDYVGCDIARRFFVELETATNTTVVNVAVDSKISFVDANTNVIKYVKGLPVATNLKRYYFTTKPNTTGTTLLRFTSATGTINVPVVIWGYNDLSVRRTVNGVPVPFRYPLYKEPLTYLKTRQTLTAGTQPPAKPVINQTNRAALPSDDYVWGALMDEGAVSRMHHVFSNILAGTEMAKGLVIPAPFTAAELTAVAPFAYHFPLNTYDLTNTKYWTYSIAGKNTGLPSNDVKSSDFHSGQFVDDGFNGIEMDGYRIHVLGMLNETRKYQMEDMILFYSTKYQQTGDPYYAHTTLVALCRLAVAFNYISTMQHFRSYAHNWNNINMRQRLSDKIITNTANVGVVDPIGIWESRSPIPNMATAYDAIFKTLSTDTQIIPYLQSKGLPITTVADIQRLIEHGIFLSFLQHASAGQDVVNYPDTQNSIAKVIRVLDYPCTDLVDLLYSGDKSIYNKYMNYSFVTSVFYTGFRRDGLKFENAGGYNANSLKVLDGLDVLNDYMDDNPTVFPLNTYPRAGATKRLEITLKSHVQSATTPWTTIQSGDAGSASSIGDFKMLDTNKKFIGDEGSPGRFIQFYPGFKSSEVAWSLVNSTGVTLPSGYPYTLQQLKDEAAKLPTNWREGAFALAGQGISVLRNGTSKDEMALYIPWQNMGHAEDVSLNLSLDGLGGRLFSHWGYAPYTHYGEPWYYSWAARNKGTLFDGTIDPMGEAIGSNDLLATSPSFNVTDNFIVKHVSNDNYDNSKWQRRINFQVKAGTGKSYFVDLYRIKGGQRHCRSYNPTLGDCAVKSISLVARPGTLAGANVNYNDATWVRQYIGANSSTPVSSLREAQALTLLYDVNEAQAPLTTWQAVWKIAVPTNTTADVSLKVNCLYSGDAKVALCTAKDPNGDHTYTRKELIWDHQGAAGTPLTSQVLNLIEAFNGADSLVKSAKYLPVTGSDEFTFTPVGFEVELKSGRKDYFIVSASTTSKSMTLPNGVNMVLDGRIGYASTDAVGNLIGLEVVEGTQLSYGSNVVTTPSAEYMCKVKDFNPTDLTVDLTGYNGDINKLNGNYMYIEKETYMRIPLKMSNAQIVDGAVRVNVDADILAQPDFKVTASAATGVISGKVYSTSHRNINAVAIKGLSGKYYRVKYAPSTTSLQLDLTGVTASEIAQDFPVDFTTTISDYAPGFDVSIPMLESSTIISGVNNPTVKHLKIVLSPNPTKGIVNILISNMKNDRTEINIYNSLGKKVYCTMQDNILTPFQLDLSGLAKGIYFVRLGGAQLGISEKLILN